MLLPWLVDDHPMAVERWYKSSLGMIGGEEDNHDDEYDAVGSDQVAH
jgi:hypothetical protein